MYSRPSSSIKQFSVESNADKLGGGAAAVVGAATAAHLGASVVKRAQRKGDQE